MPKSQILKNTELISELESLGLSIKELNELNDDYETFVFLEPPSPGKHDLRLSTRVLNPTTPSYNYGNRMIYHLDIK